MSEFHGKLIGVIGAAATGRAAAPVLSQLGARVRVYDERSAEAVGAAAAEIAPYAELFLGDAHYTGIEECDLIVPSPGVWADAPVLRAAVERGTPILSEIEVAYRIAQAPIIAITGTNGKTTTVMMVADLLRADGRQVQVAGNTLAGGFQVPLIRAAATLPSTAWIVAEISSFQLEWVEQFRPRVAIITNITADHLNRHGTVAAYAEAKARLLDAQTVADQRVLNRDNEATRGLMTRGGGQLLQFGREPHAEEGAWIERIDGRRWLRARWDGKILDLLPTDQLKVPGEHTIENALAAAIAALAVGCAPEAIAAGLAEFKGVADRLEYVCRIDGVDYVNNTMCTNVDAAIRSIEAYDRGVVLIAGGKGKGLDFEPLGRAIAERVKALVAIGDDGPEIAESARRHGFERITRATSMAEAVDQAAAVAEAGDVVLLAPACASFDWYPSFEARGVDFKQEVSRLAGGSREGRGERGA